MQTYGVEVESLKFLTNELHKEGYEEIEKLEETADTDTANSLQNDDEQSETSLDRKRKISWVWNYFYQISDRVYVGKICNLEIIQTQRNCQLLNKHIKGNHLKVHKIEVRRKKGIAELKKFEQNSTRAGAITSRMNLVNKELNWNQLVEERVNYKNVNINKKIGAVGTLELNAVGTLTPTLDKHLECTTDYTELDAVYVISKRGNLVIRLGPYTFYRQIWNRKRIRWFCKNAQRSCKATLSTIGDRIVRLYGKHDHCPCKKNNDEKKQIPEWLPLYFVKNTEKEYRCNLCENLIITDNKSLELLEHIKSLHKEVHDLHKDNPESTVGFQIEFLQFSMLKDDKTQPVILEEVCEEATDEIVKTEKSDRDQLLGMQYVLVPRKKKIKRSYEFSRKRSWVWKYFERLTSIIYRCNLCNVVLSIKGCNTNNMNRHVRTRHPSIYKSEVEKKKDLTEIDQLDVSWKKDEESDKDLDESLGESNDMIKQRRSWIWSYFRRVSNTLAQCKLCNRNICHGGNATGNMNRHLKMIHNKTADDNNWVWKVFENAEDDFFSCKICQYKCMKFDDVEKSTKCILLHLKNEHGVVSGDQIITGTEYEVENAE